MKITVATCTHKDSRFQHSGFTAIVFTCNVNLKLLQAKGWYSKSRRVVVNMFANASNCPCKQSGGEGCESWTKALVGSAVCTLFS